MFIDIPRPGRQGGGLARRRDGLLVPARLAEQKGGISQGYGLCADILRPDGQIGGLSRRLDRLLVPSQLAERPRGNS